MTAKAPQRRQAGFLIILFAAVGYMVLFLSTTPQAPDPATPSLSASTIPQPAISSLQSPVSPQPPATTTSTITTPTSAPAPTTSVPSPSTSAPSSSTLQPTTSLKDVFAPYRGRGLHLAYLELTFFGRRCANDVGAQLACEPAIKAKSFSYSQDVHWFVYDPQALPLADLVSLAGASGEATLINDTQI